MGDMHKYSFDLDFTPGARPPLVATSAAAEEAAVVAEAPPPPPQMFSEEELGTAREMAFDEGRRHGYLEGAEAAGIHAVSAIDALGRGFDQVVRAQTEANTLIMKDAAKLAMAVLRKVVPAMAAKYAFEEVTQMVENVVSNVLDEPRIIVRVIDSLVEPVRERMVDVASAHGFEGRVVVQGDARVELGDVRVEWTDGGAERDWGRLMAQAEEIVERGLAAPDGDAVKIEDTVEPTAS